MKNIHGGDIYQYNNILDFSANINPLGAPESVNRSIADAIGQIGHYPEMYSDSLRKAIGEKYHIDHLRKWSGGRYLSVCVCGKTEENSGDGTLLCGV